MSDDDDFVNDDEEVMEKEPEEEERTITNEEDEEEEKVPSTLASASKKKKAPSAPAAGAAPKKQFKVAAPGVGSGKDPVSLVVEYLTGVNRPYSASVLVDNLHKEVPMTKLKKILEEQAVAGVLGETGDTCKVYWANQDNLPQVDEQEISKLKQQVVHGEAALVGLNKVVSQHVGEIGTLLNAPSNADIPLEMKKLQAATDAINAQLNGFIDIAAACGSDEPVVLVEVRQELSFWNKEKKSRLECVREVLQSAGEAQGRDWKALAEEIGAILD